MKHTAPPTTEFTHTEPAATATPNYGFSRRRFMTALTAGGASLALQACGGGAGAGSVESRDTVLLASATSGGLTARGQLPAGSTAITTFQLTSTTAGASVPFSIGQPFRKGQVAAGARVIGSISELQVVWKNTWPDGSLKFAIVSGRAPLAAGVPLTVTLSVGTGSTVADLTLDNLRATNVVASVAAGAFGTATWTGSDWSAPFMNWTSGPFMSSWIYRKAVGNDPHLAAWLEVRLYRGGAVEILPWIENGYLKVPNPTNKQALYSFSLGGTERYSGTIDLPNHCRTVLVSGTTLSHWLGATPAVTPNHDKAYLQSTGLVPTYRASIPASAAVWSTLAQSYTPLQQGNYANAMGMGGYQPSIGLLPEWDVLYLASNDARAFAGVMVNAFSAGRYGIHYRDEATFRPLRFSSYPNLVATDYNTGLSNTGASTKNTYTPAASGTVPQTWDNPHHPAIGYTAYLLTGRFYFLEELQFTATMNYLLNTDATRKFSGGVFMSNAGANTTRGAAWALRTLAQAAAITPDADPLRAEFSASMAANVDFYHATYVAQPNNPFGFVAPYSSYTTGKFSEAAWMQDFFTAAVGYAIDVDAGMPSVSNGKLTGFFAWKAQSVIGRLGGTAQSDYLFCDAAVYTIAIAPSDSADFVGGTGPWYPNWSGLYQATLGMANPGISGPLRGGNFPDASSYWGNLQPAIAYAVRHNVPGALAAYTRMLGASNWKDLAAGFDATPVWSVAPNGQTVTTPAPAPAPAPTNLPAWVPPVGYFADVPMVNFPADCMPAMYRNSPTDTAAMDTSFIMWGGSAILRDFSALGAQVYFAAGHESSAAQPNIQMTLICDFSTLTWSTANLPLQQNLPPSFVNGYAPDGTPYCPHSYLGLQEVPKAWGGGAKGSLASFFCAGSVYDNRINFMDVSRPTMGYSVLTTRQPGNTDPSKIQFQQGARGDNYPITVMDASRGGWWAAVNGSAAYTLFVSKSGDITQYPALGGNLANGSMVLCESLNLLVAVDGGYNSGPNVGTGYRSLYLRDLSTGVTTRSTTLGTVPSLANGYDGGINNFSRPDVMGLQWVEELGCIVGFDQSAAQPTIVKLTPPAKDPANGAWTWSTVTVAHWPQDSSGQPALQTCVNNIWSKFRWVPSLRGFVYGTSKDRRPQVIRIG